jgi:hypothetical protein
MPEAIIAAVDPAPLQLYAKRRIKSCLTLLLTSSLLTGISGHVIG